MTSVRGGVTAAVAFALFTTLLASCGELTGPESPSTPTDVKAVLLSSNSVKITWTPSPLNDGVISYSIYRDGAKVGESETTEFTDTGLAQQTTYVYSVAANCKGGIVSDRSVETSESTVTTIDITRPTVIATSPVDGATGVSRAGTSTVTFSEPMDPATINTSTFNIRVTSSGQILAGTVTYNATTRVAEFIPSSPLPNTTQLTVTVTTGVKDLAGNALATPFTARWTTRDEDGPTVTASLPAQGAQGVSANTAITVTFSEPVQPSTVNTTNLTLKVTATGANVPGTITFNGTNTATFTPSSPLVSATSYTFTVTGLRDIPGNDMPAPFVLTFTVGDLIPPTVVSTSPEDLATGVSTTAAITVTFSEPMSQATITTSTFFVRPTAGGSNVPGVVTYNAATNTATFTPTGALAGSTAYTATVTTGAKDLAGNSLAANKTWTFATGDVTAPTVTAVSPANGATNVATNTTIQVTFSEPMDASTIIPANITLRNTATSAAVTVTVAYNSATQIATITPTSALSNLTNYTLTVSTAVKDAAGNAMAAPFVSTFTTIPVPDTTRPTITGRSPAPGATLVAANTTVMVTFSEPIDQTTITSANFKLAPTASPGSPVTTAFSYNAATNTVTMTPSTNLGSNVQYTVTVGTGVKDLSGNTLLAQDTWTFTTITDTTAPTVLSTTPTNNATNVAVNSSISVVFSEDMSAATIDGTSFTVKTTVGATPVAGTVSYNAATRTATFAPTGNLTANTGYTVTITSAAKDLAGNGLAGSFTFQFTTAP